MEECANIFPFHCSILIENTLNLALKRLRYILHAAVGHLTLTFLYKFLRRRHVFFVPGFKKTPSLTWFIFTPMAERDCQPSSERRRVP